MILAIDYVKTDSTKPDTHLFYEYVKMRKQEQMYHCQFINQVLPFTIKTQF